jgi:FSR family fosmidomycin resistance protein-like MFS transporter
LHRKTATYQWAQLSVLAGVHFLLDMFASVLPPILPSIRDAFVLRLSLAGSVLIAMTLASNAVQVFTGHLRAQRTRPLLLHLGLVLGAGICLLAALPRTSAAFVPMLALAVLSGCGIGVAHPEGLRAIHSLDRIPSAISTGVFMAGGFIGFAAGGTISALLVDNFRLPGLYPLTFLPLAGILLLIVLRVKMAVEPGPNDSNESTTPEIRLPFWLIVLMTLPSGIATTIVASLLPTVLSEMDFDLAFGGYSLTIYGLGGALGSFLWAALAHRKGPLPSSIAAYLLTIPFLVAYLLCIDSRAAIWLLFGAGFCSFGAYILMITLARCSFGFNLGRRMGFIVGGTWAFSNLVLWALLPAAERLGTDLLLRAAPVGYLLSGAIGIWLLLKNRTPAAQE